VAIKRLTHPSGRLTVILLVAALANYLVMVLVTLPALDRMSGGLAPFDMMPFGYEPVHTFHLLTDLKAQGRGYYLFRQIPLDTLYPALFALSFFMATNWLADRWMAMARPLRVLAILPLFAALADYTENFLIVSMLRAFPDTPDSLVQTANIATLTKSGLTTVFFVGFILALIGWGISRIRNRSKL